MAPETRLEQKMYLEWKALTEGLIPLSLNRVFHHWE